MIHITEIETERLLLTKFKYEYSTDMLKYWVSKPEIQHLYSEPVYTTEEDVKKLLDKYISAYETDTSYRWAIIEKESKCCIGQIAFFVVNNVNKFAEIEYCVGTEFQCKGYMTEAVKAVLKYGFKTLGLHRIQISTKSINAPSQRVIEKCGFTYEGTLRDFFYYDGKFVDRLYFSMLESEYKE